MESLLTLLVVVMVFGMLLIRASHHQKIRPVSVSRAQPRPTRPATVAYPKNSKTPTRAYRALLTKQREAEQCGNFEAALLAAERALQYLPGMLAESGDSRPSCEDYPCIETACRFWGAKQNRAGLERLQAMLAKLPELEARYRANLELAFADARLSDNLMAAIGLQSGLSETELAQNLGAEDEAIARIADALVQLNLLVATVQHGERRLYLPETQVRATTEPLFAKTA